MKWFLLFLLSLPAPMVIASEDGRSIYLSGTDSDGLAIKYVMNDLEIETALACVNCHRESGLGTSESGRTIPPVSWQFLSKDQPADKQSRFYHIQKKRPAYDAALLHRILTTGINSKGVKADPLMPRYELTQEQTGHLLEYLKTLYPGDDPGVDEDTIKIATVIDPRLPEDEKQQHREFIEGLFKMKNSATRGELRRKKYAPIQKAPQWEAYRKWELLVWELPLDTGLWEQALNQYYQDQPVFVVLSPLVRDSYSGVQKFCSAEKVPCLFPHKSVDSNGDYYNFVYRDSRKQRRDYIRRKLRNEKNELLFLDSNGEIENIRQGQFEIPKINKVALKVLGNQFDEICVKPNTLVLAVDNSTARDLYKMKCPGEQEIKIMLLGEPSVSYQDIVVFMKNYPDSGICWITNYEKVLRKNFREIRVSVLTDKFGMSQVKNEELAQDLYAFGLLADSMHQLVEVFSRSYLLENIEHMLNSYPNYTYFSSVSGAPNQRSIVGSYKEFCPGKSQT